MEQFKTGSRESLFFIHIPKTAGMSMRLYLSGQYRAETVCSATQWQDILGREGELKNYRLVQGHFRYNLRELVAANARTLVILRDPLRRTISALRHLQRDPAFHEDHELAKRLTLSGLLRNPRLMQKQHNVQARYLCASRPAAQVSADLQRATAKGADAGAGEPVPTLDLAQERLTAIDFIGLTEDIGSVVDVMAKQMNYHSPLYFPFINHDPEYRDPLQGLTDEDLEILRTYNDIDLQLYAFAERLIVRRRFQRSMRDLVRSGVYRVPAGSFEIPLSGIIPGSGWYDAERNGDSVWRWTGPGRYFTLELPLRSDASYRLSLRFDSVRPLMAGEFTAEVNDVPIEFEVEWDAGSYCCDIVIPRALLAQNDGFCCLRFDTHETARSGPNDVRPLGVSMQGIVFRCLDG